jgi:hypothetical protein
LLVATTRRLIMKLVGTTVVIVALAAATALALGLSTDAYAGHRVRKAGAQSRSADRRFTCLTRPRPLASDRVGLQRWDYSVRKGRVPVRDLVKDAAKRQLQRIYPRSRVGEVRIIHKGERVQRPFGVGTLTEYEMKAQVGSGRRQREIPITASYFPRTSRKDVPSVVTHLPPLRYRMDNAR